MTSEPHDFVPRNASPRQCKAEPTPKGVAWQARWEKDYRARWRTLPGHHGLFPVPDAAAPKPKRDQVQFFLIIARRAPP